jgi:hypothetical protein
MPAHGTADRARCWAASREASTMDVRADRVDHDDRDEGRHRPDHDGPGWSETFAYELATADGFGVAVHVTVHPFERRAWYWCVVARPDAPVVAVVDVDVPLPNRAASLELRTDGLWADHNVETPWQHVSVGLEAFGLALDDPRALLGDGRGDRVPVGLDLEWESAPEAVIDHPLGDVNGYEVSNGRAHGELLLGADAFELDGPGWREHHWGAIDWWQPEPSARRWAAAEGWWRSGFTNAAGPDLPAWAAAPDGTVVEFPLPSFGDRRATAGLGLVTWKGDPDGVGWLWRRVAPDDRGRRG